MSEQSETQEGAIKPKKRFSRTAGASKAQDGCPAAAPVETGAAADTKNRRENTRDGVLKVTLAIDAISLIRVHQWLGWAREFPFLCSAASRGAKVARL
jgi:hypothetical protein